MRIAKNRTEARPGFTLVELMVSLALILFIMAILSQAFVVGMDTFRDMKGIGDMEERLRSATQILRRDLAADHFEGRRRLSDPNFWTTTVREGFFKIDQGTKIWNPPTFPPQLASPPAGSLLEGIDPDGIVSIRAPSNLDDSTAPPRIVTDPVELMERSHRLHFTAKLRGNEKDKYFSASIAPPSPLYTSPTNFFGQPFDSRFQEGDSYNSPWAEIGYYLRYTGQAGATPLFALYRTQRVITPDNRDLNWPTYKLGLPDAVNHQEMSWVVDATPPPPPKLRFLNPSDVAGTEVTPPLRASLQNYPFSVLNPPPAGTQQERAATLLLTDVVSFDVQVLKHRFSGPSLGVQPNFEDLDVWQVVQSGKAARKSRLFDTNPYQFEIQYPAPNFTTDAVPIMKSSIIKALQISIRVWDAKTQQARQVTIVQEM